MSEYITVIRSMDDYNKFKRDHEKCVFMYSANYCAVCKEILPLYERIGKRYQDKIALAFADIDVCGIELPSVPLFTQIYKGKKYNEMDGVAVKSLKDFVKNAILITDKDIKS